MTFLGFQNLKDAIFCSSIPFSSLTTYCATMISALKTSSPLLLVVAVQVLLVLHHQIGSSNAASSNTIQQGQTLKDYDALVSPNGLFRLGFYGAGPLNSRYLAISFNAGYVAGAINVNPVWIANRNTPLSDSTGLLSLDHNGTLKLENADHSVSIVFYSSDPDQVSRINGNNSLVTATLLDSGNLVLVEKNLSSGHERLLWQSFDYPTDAFLPGMRLSINRKTGQIKSLTSRLSDKVPCSGAFTLGVSTVSNASELVIQRRGVTYWRSGVWTGRGFSSPYTLMNLNDPQYTFSYSVGEEKYFSYSKKTESADIMVWVLSEIGQLQKYTVWVSGGMSGPVTVIQCGTRNGNASAAGCETPELPSCRSRRVQFRPRRGTMASNASAMVTPRGAVDLNVSTSDCEDECRRNCSCVAYAPVSPIDHVGCYFWFKGSQFIRDEKLDNVVFFLPNHRALKQWIWFLMAAAMALVLLFIIPLIYLRWKRIRPFDRRQTRQDVLIQLRTMSSSEDGGDSLDFQLFSLDTVLSATDSFSAANKLGEGGFGPVYRGKLVGGQQIAVKRLSGKSGQGLKEFKNEIILIAKLQHMNLVRLLGCCIDGEERILIYEYMPNNSLESLIVDPIGRKLLDWNKRLKVIEGIAQGLLYLHQYSRSRIIHRDLKAGNILLDAEMNAKISDFGTARIFKQNESSNTKRIIGTYGYMSPEYAMNGIFSVKSDVFSYGVLLLEIVSGRKNTSFDEFDSHLNLIGFAWELWQRNAAAELMDPLLAATSCPDNSPSFVMRCIHVGLLCVQERAVDRPTMLEVVSMFANEAMVLPSPKQPAFSTGENMMEPILCREESAMCSHNTVTISTLSGR